MHDTTALVGSFASFALLAFIYYSNILTRPGSWLRGDTIGMFTLALFTGFFCMAIAAEITWIAGILEDNATIAGVLSDMSDMVSLAIIAATVVLFWILVRTINRQNRAAPSSQSK